MAFMRKKIETHVEYCEHLLDAAKVHCEAAEREEQQNRQRLEVARQLERRKQEDELERVMQQEEHFERIRTRKVEVVKGGERKAEKGGGRIRGRTFYENEEGFIDDEQEEMEEEDAKQLSGQAERKIRRMIILQLLVLKKTMLNDTRQVFTFIEVVKMYSVAMLCALRKVD
ncbi:hypothetical protein HPP92_012115 [Vanilla planifolia]|uniref:Uncharacterized protein n=1 Tax=Vanilla planifolia TaxID=51239 RepID=A0A835V5N9_VANPL|nr:hypothetical protein HPP92_012115 [Vanilla planifolia]